MIELTSEVAELLGAHVGDGTLYRTNRGIVWEIRGALEEKDYYIQNICPLLNTIFNLEIISKFRNGGPNGVWGVQTTKKLIIQLFLDYGFNSGRKTHTVQVPDYIINTNDELKKAFVRGLFDTDGCLRFDKINNKPDYSYPRIEFSSASRELRNTLNTLLITLGFRTFIWNDRNNFCLSTTGIKMLEKWINEIKPRNPKHLKKYYNWKEKGFYNPNMH